MVVLIINHHLIGPQEAKNIMDVRETKGLHHLSSPHLPKSWVQEEQEFIIHDFLNVI